MVNKKIALGIIVLLCINILTGCVDVVKLSSESFIVGLGIDYHANSDKEEMEVTIAEIPLSKKKTKEQGNAAGTKTMLISSSGKSLSDCLQDIRTKIRRKFTLDKLKYIVFSDATAEHGIQPYMEYFSRSGEVDQRAHLFVTKGSSKKFLQEGGEMLQEFIMNDYSVDKTYIPSMLWQMIRLSEWSLKSGYLNEIGINDEKILVLRGEASLLRDRLAMKTDMDTSKIFNILVSENVKSLTLFANDERKESFVVQSSKRKITYHPDSVTMSYHIKLLELENQRNERQSELVQLMEAHIRKELLDLWNKSSSKGIDMIGIGEKFRQKGWNTKDWEKKIKALNKKINVKVTIISDQGRRN